MDDRYCSTNGSNSNTTTNCKAKSKKKKRSRNKKKVTSEQILASKAVHEWVFPDALASNAPVDDFLLLPAAQRNGHRDRTVFELHSHSICSDGFLSPSALVQRAHRNGTSCWVHCLFLANQRDCQSLIGAVSRFCFHWFCAAETVLLISFSLSLSRVPGFV